MRKITYFLNEGDRNRLLNEDSTIFFEFKEVIDIYCVTDKARGLKEHAIYGNASGGSCFLLKIQNLGHTSLSTITDEDTLPFFVVMGKLGLVAVTKKKSQLYLRLIWEIILRKYIVFI